MGLTCKICFESATGQGAKARITSCGHVFCHPCSAIWFRSETACPVCRSPVPGSSALVALFDHDAGLQSPSLGLADDNNNDGGGGGGSAGLISEEGQQPPQRESPKTMAGPGMENAGGAGAASNSGDNEDVQVSLVGLASHLCALSANVLKTSSSVHLEGSPGCGYLADTQPHCSYVEVF
jgi:hypothetical protein